MQVTRILVTTATALSMLAVIGCSSTKTDPEVATAPITVPSEAPVQPAAADTMPSHPALASDSSAQVTVTDDVPAASPPATSPPADMSSEPAPKADRG